MPVELKIPLDGNIHVSEMRDGQLAIIISWMSGDGQLGGWPVQRFGHSLVPLGRASDDGWLDAFSGTRRILPDRHPRCRVRIIPDEVEIVVKDNQ